MPRGARRLPSQQSRGCRRRVEQKAPTMSSSRRAGWRTTRCGRPATNRSSRVESSSPAMLHSTSISLTTTAPPPPPGSMMSRLSWCQAVGALPDRRCRSEARHPCRDLRWGAAGTLISSARKTRAARPYRGETAPPAGGRAKAVNQGIHGGETGIRTLGPREGSTVFETAPFDHSGTSPRGSGRAG